MNKSAFKVLENLANELDRVGANKIADYVTDLMVKEAEIFQQDRDTRSRFPSHGSTPSKAEVGSPDASIHNTGRNADMSHDNDVIHANPAESEVDPSRKAETSGIFSPDEPDVSDGIIDPVDARWKYRYIPADKVLEIIAAPPEYTSTHSLNSNQGREYINPRSTSTPAKTNTAWLKLLPLIPTVKTLGGKVGSIIDPGNPEFTYTYDQGTDSFTIMSAPRANGKAVGFVISQTSNAKAWTALKKLVPVGTSPVPTKISGPIAKSPDAVVSPADDGEDKKEEQTKTASKKIKIEDLFRGSEYKKPSAFGR